MPENFREFRDLVKGPVTLINNTATGTGTTDTRGVCQKAVVYCSWSSASIDGGVVEIETAPAINAANWATVGTFVFDGNDLTEFITIDSPFVVIRARISTTVINGTVLVVFNGV